MCRFRSYRSISVSMQEPEQLSSKPAQPVARLCTAIKRRGSSTPTSWHSGNLPRSHYVHVSLAHLCTVEKHCKGSQLIETAGLAEQNPRKQFLPVMLNRRPAALPKAACLHSHAFWRCSPLARACRQTRGAELPTKASH